MSDPIERLRHLDPGPAIIARTPAEVRRRGEQIRRRRRGAMGATAALVVAAIVVPLTLLTTPSQQTVPAPPATPTSIPADFPLTSGWPDSADAEPGPRSGVTGPRTDLADPVFDYRACGEALPVPETADRLRATYRSAEDLRSRQLLVFADTDQSVEFMADLAAFYRACPDDPGSPRGAAYVRAVVTTGVGGESYAAGGFPPAGQPIGSTQVLHAVRLGTAVLLDTTESEGGGGTDLDALTRQRAELMTSNSVAPLAAMCRFTVAGC